MDLLIDNSNSLNMEQQKEEAELESQLLSQINKRGAFFPSVLIGMILTTLLYSFLVLIFDPDTLSISFFIHLEYFVMFSFVLSAILIFLGIGFGSGTPSDLDLRQTSIPEMYEPKERTTNLLSTLYLAFGSFCIGIIALLAISFGV